MNIIDFDGKIITNRLGLFEICSDADDAEAIFQYLITSNKALGDAPDIYFFIDAVTYLIFDYELFVKYQIIDDPEYSFKKVLILYLKSEFLVFIKKYFIKELITMSKK